MQFKINQVEDELKIDVEGRLDTKTTPELEAALEDTSLDVSKVTFDFDNLDYISSSGLRLLLVVYKEMAKRGGTMVVINANESIQEVFEATGFDGIFDVG